MPPFPKLATTGLSETLDLWESERGLLELWIATYDKEITVGFDDHTGECDWHTHMSQFGANEPHEEFVAMSQLLTSILTDQEAIVLSSKSGYSLTDDVDWEVQKPDKNQTLQSY